MRTTDCLCCGAPLADGRCELCGRPAPENTPLRPAAARLLQSVCRGIPTSIGPRSTDYAVANALHSIGALEIQHRTRSGVCTYTPTLYGRALALVHSDNS